jgi:hypothetical protein
MVKCLKQNKVKTTRLEWYTFWSILKFQRCSLCHITGNNIIRAMPEWYQTQEWCPKSLLKKFCPSSLLQQCSKHIHVWALKVFCAYAKALRILNNVTQKYYVFPRLQLFLYCLLPIPFWIYEVLDLVVVGSVPQDHAFDLLNELSHLK